MAGNQMPGSLGLEATEPALAAPDGADEFSAGNAPPPHGALGRALRALAERVSARIGARQLPLLLDRRDRVRHELRAIPERMQKVTNQAGLVLELVDDYRAGGYRNIPWRSLVIAAGALLYSVSPNDVVPDFLPILGQLDDALVLAVAMRWIRRDLQRYARFKGYDPKKYF